MSPSAGPSVAKDRVGGPRVGFLREDFLPASETFIHTSLSALDRYQASVFALRRSSPQKFPFRDVTVLRDQALGRLEARLYRLTTLSPRFLAWVGSVDLVHVHMGFHGVHALAASALLGRPLVVSYYGRDVALLSSPERFLPTHWHYLLFHRVLWQRADRILALSDHMARELIAQGVPADKVRIVPLGVDLRRFDAHRRIAHDGPLVVLMVGREIDKKGFDDGLRACALAKAAGVPLLIQVLGFGADLAGALRALAHRLELDVEWLDPTRDVAETMAAADILLAPSRTAADGDQEGTPTVICEASASGLPVVSTRHAGIPEQVEHGLTGLLGPERDPEELARHLIALARDPAMRYEMGRAGRDRMERRFSLMALRENLQATYDELVSARTARTP